MQYTFSILGSPIRKSADRFIFADTRSLSQLIASFIASESQGIPRVPFLTFFYTCRFCPARYAFLIVAFLLPATGYRPSAQGRKPVADDYRPKNNVSTVVFSFNYLFPICQRTFCPCRRPVPLLRRESQPFKASVENNGFEPLTPCVQGRCSSQLS